MSQNNFNDEKYYPFPGYFAFISIILGIMSFVMMYIPLITGSLICLLPALMGVVFGVCGLKSPRKGLSVVGILVCLSFFAFIAIGISVLMAAQGK